LNREGAKYAKEEKRREEKRREEEGDEIVTADFI
jgi:hypothetical protein